MTCAHPNCPNPATTFYYERGERDSLRIIRVCPDHYPKGDQ